MINKKIFLSILFGILLLPVVSLAVTIQSMVDAAVNTALYIASGIVVIFWIVTGVLFLTAQGDASKLTSARKSLLMAIGGTILVIVASGAISLVKGAFGL